MQKKSLNHYPEHFMLAIQAAVSASEVLMNFYQDGFSTTYKSDKSPVTEADVASSHVINSILEKTSIPIIGEEIINKPFQERASWEQNWCVDPLDGTKEFIKKNGEFAINIALIQNHKPIFGLIASPVQQQILVGDSTHGVFIIEFSTSDSPEKWSKIEASNRVNSPITLASSRSHVDEHLGGFIQGLEEKNGAISYIKKGSALKFFDLASGKVDIYPRFAPTMEWDIASGQAIMEALGGSIVNAYTQKPLIYNKEDLRNPAFVASSKAFLAL